MFVNMLLGIFNFAKIKEFLTNKIFLLVLLVIFVCGIMYFIHIKNNEITTLVSNKAQLTAELATLEINLGSAKARLANLQNEKELADKMYADIKNHYSIIDDKLEINKQTIKKLLANKGSQDEKILETKITTSIANVANGGVLMAPEKK